MVGTALVTGGAKRIGRAISLALAKQGCNIALHYNTSRDDAEQLSATIRDAGRQCELFQCDLNDMQAVQSLMDRVFDAFPDCNILINNASVFPRVSMLETDETLFDRAFNVNFKAAFFLSRDFAAACQTGQIINILDTKIAGNFTQYFVYSLTKKVLADFTQMAARALGPNIRVNGVCPGLILPTPDQTDAYLDRLAERIPMRHKGSPDDVVAAVLYLLENEFTTGQCIFADGGEHLL